MPNPLSTNSLSTNRPVSTEAIWRGTWTGFSYSKNVNAAYVSLRAAGRRTSYQAGLRAEQTNTQAYFSGAAARERHYVQLFPSMSVQRSARSGPGTR